MILNYKFNKDKLFFTSDLHFYHKNIIDFCSRPFENIEHMNAMLIKNWNSVVQPDDDVIIAGDFMFSSNLEYLENILNQLNGTKWLVLGNHDYMYNFLRPNAVSLFLPSAIPRASNYFSPRPTSYLPGGRSSVLFCQTSPAFFPVC